MSRARLLKLTVQEGESDPRHYTLSGPLVGVGKAPDNAVHLSSSFISRRHGEFTCKDDGWHFRDLGSTNGTRVEREGAAVRLKAGRGVQEVLLRGGERLVVGSVRIDVHLAPMPEDQGPEPVIQAACNPAQALTVFDLVPEGNALRLLFDTVHALSSCTDPLQVLDQVGRAVFDAIPSITHLFMFERTGKGPQRWLVRWTRERGGHSGDMAPMFSQTLLDQVIDRNESLRFSSMQGSVPSTESLRRARITSTVCVPLRGVNGFLGVLQADCRRTDRRARELQDRDLHLITLLGEQLAVMLDRMRITRNIQQMFEGFVNASIRAIESRDPPTAGHSERVARYCLRVAKAINETCDGPFRSIRLNEGDLRTLRYAALLHDFGKVGVKEALLLKARKLTEPKIAEIESRFKLADMELRAMAAERKVTALTGDTQRAPERIAELDVWLERERDWLRDEQIWLMEQMKPFPIREDDIRRLERLTQPIGQVRLLEPAELSDMLSCRGSLTAEERRHIELHAYHTRCYLELIPWSDDLARVPLIAGSHHEKLNGGGYPLGTRSDQLPLEARILTVCDIYDALTAADRPYRTAMTATSALRILRQEVQDGGVDGEVLGVLEHVLIDDPELSDEPHVEEATSVIQLAPRRRSRASGEQRAHASHRSMSAIISGPRRVSLEAPESE